MIARRSIIALIAVLIACVASAVQTEGTVPGHTSAISSIRRDASLISSIMILDNNANDLSSLVVPSIMSGSFDQSQLAYGIAVSSAVTSLSFNPTFSAGDITLQVAGSPDAVCTNGQTCGSASNLQSGVNIATLHTSMSGDFVFTITVCGASYYVLANACVLSPILNSVSPLGVGANIPSFALFAGTSISFGSSDAIGANYASGVGATSISGSAIGSSVSSASLASTLTDAQALIAAAQSYSCDSTVTSLDGATVNPGTTCGSLSLSATMNVNFDFGSASSVLRPQFVLVASDIFFGSSSTVSFSNSANSAWGSPTATDVFWVGSSIEISSGASVSGMFLAGAGGLQVFSGAVVQGGLLSTSTIIVGNGVLFNPTQVQASGSCSAQSIIAPSANGILGDGLTDSATTCDSASVGAFGLAWGATCTQSCSSGYIIDTSSGSSPVASCSGTSMPLTFTPIACVLLVQCTVLAPVNGLVTLSPAVVAASLARKRLIASSSKVAKNVKVNVPAPTCAPTIQAGTSCSQICSAGYALTGSDATCAVSGDPSSSVGVFTGQTCSACGVDFVSASDGTNLCSACPSGSSTLGQTGQSECTAVYCATLPPTNGVDGDSTRSGCDATLYANGLALGSTCTQSCSSRFRLDTSPGAIQAATCTDGSKNPATFTPISCVPITCSAKAPSNGALNSLNGVVVTSASFVKSKNAVAKSNKLAMTYDPCTSYLMSTGAQCTLSCVAGYQLSSAYSSCSVTGAFVGQSCSQCPQDTYSASLGSSLCQQCPSGTSTMGALGATSCTQLTCTASAPSIGGNIGDGSSNGCDSDNIATLGLAAGSTCTQNCQPGYKIDTTQLTAATCTGTYMNMVFTAQTCVAITCPIIAPVNGAINSFGVVVTSGSLISKGKIAATIPVVKSGKDAVVTTPCVAGAQQVNMACTMSCNAGYQLLPSTAGSVCTAAQGATVGTWTAQQCGKCPIDFYQSSTSAAPCTPCSSMGAGYNTQGQTGASTCVPLTCTVLAPSFGSIGDGSSTGCDMNNIPSTGLAAGSSCAQFCQAGYTIDTTLQTTATCTGTSYPAVFAGVTCIPITCSTTTPANGNLGSSIAVTSVSAIKSRSVIRRATTAPSPCTSDLMLIGSTCMQSCSAGYELVGASSSCDLGSPSNNIPATVGSFTSQTCAQCQANYFQSSQTGSSCAACTSGTWTNGAQGQTSCSTVFCTPTAPNNGALPSGTSTIAYGTSVSATCNTNYVLRGTATACGASGTFVQSQSCAPVLCVPSLPAFGTIGITSSRNPCTSASITAGTSCDQGCVYGYSLAGSATATCSSTGATGIVGVFTSPTCVANVLVAASTTTSSVTAAAFAVDGNNNQYYVSGDAIMKLAPTTGAVAINFSSGFTALFGSVPTSITLDVAGNVWAVLGSSKVTSSILVLVPSSGAKAYTFAKAPSTSSNLIQIKADPAKTTLYIVDGSAAGGILSLAIGNQAYSASGSVGHMRQRAVHTTSFTAGTLKTYTTGLGSPTSLVWSADGNTLYVAEAAGIVTVTGGGSTVTPFSTNVAVQSAGTIAIDKSGNVYVVSAVTTSTGASTIVKITSTGAVSTFLSIPAVVDGSTSSTAAVTLAFDSNGSLLVSGPSIGGLKSVTTGGVCTVTAASNGGSTTSSASTGCGATLANGATCTQQCALGYTASSSIASCTGVAQFNPTVCTLIPVAAVSVPIGRCSSFAALSGTSMTFAGTANNIASNNIGVSPGTSITGAVAVLGGSQQINSNDANNCAADAKAALAIGVALACKALPAVDMANTVITPGTWCSPTLMISAGTVTFDGQGSANSMFVMRAASTISTAAMTNIVLINGASNANIIWIIGSSATLGASSTFVGTMYAAVSVTVGGFVTIRGRIFAAVTTTFAGMLTLDSSTTSSSTSSSSSSSSSSTSSTTGASSSTSAAASSLVIGRCASFAAVAGTTITWAGTGNTVASNSIGVSPGTSITGAVALSSGTAQSNSADATNCATDAKASLTIGTSLVCTPLPAFDLSGLTITPGTYCSATLGLSAGKVTLDAQGNANAMFVFRTTTTLITAASTSLVLINGATNANVIWIIGSSATLGASSIFVGTIYSSVSVTVGASASVYGRIYAQAATTFAGFNTLAPTGPASSSSSSSSSSSATGAASSTTGSATGSASATGVAVASLSLSCSSTLNGTSSCLSTYSLLAGSAITLGATSTIGATVGAVTAITAATNVITVGDAKGVALANAQALSLLTASSSLTCTKTIGSDITGLTFGPGVYCSTTGTFIIAALGSVTLAGNGVAGSQFIFRTTTTFTTGAGVTIAVTGTAVAADVVYAIGTAVTTGANNNLVGSFVCGTAATVGAMTNIVGRVATQTAITLGALVSVKTA